MRTLLVGIGLAVLAFFGTIWVASEYGGEVVTLRTRDAGGAIQETRLWIVEHDSALWLRAGDPSSGWLQRLEATPEVEIQRGPDTELYTAVAVPDKGPEVDARMAEKYGWGDRVIGVIRSEGASIAVRLDPRDA